MDRSVGNSLISEISAQITGLAININQVHSLTFTKFYRPELETVVSDWFISQDYYVYIKQFCAGHGICSTSPYCPVSSVEYHKRNSKQPGCVETKGVH